MKSGKQQSRNDKTLTAGNKTVITWHGHHHMNYADLPITQAYPAV